jgi:hypothetical protein
MPAELKSEFYGRFLKGRLQPLANHHSANFVVQAWMAACDTPQQVGTPRADRSILRCGAVPLACAIQRRKQLC